MLRPSYPNSSFRVLSTGGDEQNRTVDPLLAKQVLSQLSYAPVAFVSREMVGSRGLEPPTSRLSGVRSNRLSYEPISSGRPLHKRAFKIKQRSKQSRTRFLMYLTLDETTLAEPLSLHRKEVIQPLVLERLPCYDFTPIANPTFGISLLAVRILTSGITGSHGVTGGVYKARERIHRGMLIRDY